MVRDGPALDGREKALELALRTRGVMLADVEERLVQAEETAAERGQP